ncbi:MAG: 6-phosphofructokinase, partial [Rikenellaceae bacterium]|nr:6-phosphofructokinase [Rikenellaceae bacterium]
MKEAVAILCAGGPAPGINTVISSVTKIFTNNGYTVIGLNGGYKSLFADEPDFTYLDFALADTLYSRGGS